MGVNEWQCSPSTKSNIGHNGELYILSSATSSRTWNRPAGSIVVSQSIGAQSCRSKTLAGLNKAESTHYMHGASRDPPSPALRVADAPAVMNTCVIRPVAFSSLITVATNPPRAEY